MTRETSVAGTAPVPQAVLPGGKLRWLWQAENLLVALALAALVVLPLIQVVGRKFFHGGLSGGAALQQHLVLIIGLLGGMFAARDRRLLSLSTLTNFLTGRWQMVRPVVQQRVCRRHHRFSLCRGGATGAIGT